MQENLLKLPKNSFNAIRLLCCLIVIFGHCLDLSGITRTIFWRSLIDMHTCVCVFFILSGFFVTYSYIKNSDKETLIQFYKKRAKRILPAYYIAVGFCAVSFFFFSGLSAKEYFLSSQFWKYLFWNSILLNFMCNCPVPAINGGGYDCIVPVNGALWTIKIEVAFYLVLPLVIYWLKKCKTKKGQNILLIAFYLMSIFWNEAFLFLGTKLGSSFIKDLAHQFPGFVSYFACGMFYVLNYELLRKNENKIIIPAILIFALHYITKTEFLMPAALTVIVMYIGFKFTIFSEIGKVDYSYGMYLFHFPIIQMCVMLGFFKQMPAVIILMITASSFLLSYLTIILDKKISKRN